MTGRPAVFLDRDGTLIEDMDYLSDPARVRVLPGVRAALGRLRAAGFLLVIVTNQSGIGRGYFTEDDHAAVAAAVRTALDIDLDGEYHCPHAPDDGCDCRKPSPGMLCRAAEDLAIDLSRSVMVGDREGDALAGLAAGCRSVVLGTGPAPEAAERARDLSAAVALILGDRNDG